MAIQYDKSTKELMLLAYALQRARRDGESMDICNKIIEWSRKNADLIAPLTGRYSEEELEFYDFARVVGPENATLRFRVTQESLDALESFARYRKMNPDRDFQKAKAPEAIIEIIKHLRTSPFPPYSNIAPLHWFRPKDVHETVDLERAVTRYGTYEAWGGGGCYLDGARLDRASRGDERSLAGAKAVAERHHALQAAEGK